MARKDGRIVVEMTALQRLRVEPALPAGQRDQGHRGLGPPNPGTVGRGNLNADVGVPPDPQQVRTLLAHDCRTSHDIAQAALVQDRDVKRAVDRQEALLSAQSRPDSLLHDFKLRGAATEQRMGVLRSLQESRNHLLLIGPQRHRLRIHLRPPLEPVRMLHFRVPVDPAPQPQQHAARQQQFVALPGEGLLRYAAAAFHAGHLRAVARDLVREFLLGVSRRLPEVPQDLPEHGGIGGCRSTLCIASSSAHRIPLGARR